ncbi:hypothetical protein PSTT_08161, partial [Puccinia striiformis]
KVLLLTRKHREGPEFTPAKIRPSILLYTASSTETARNKEQVFLKCLALIIQVRAKCDALRGRFSQGAGSDKSRWDQPKTQILEYQTGADLSKDSCDSGDWVMILKHNIYRSPSRQMINIFQGRSAGKAPMPSSV